MRRRAALAAAQEKDAADSNTEGQFELSSRANVLAAKVLGLPMRDDMFEILRLGGFPFRG
jgi:hypothetical protein